MSKQKILSISIAAYNLAGMIDECLASFTESKHIDELELIVTDDGSKDETKSKVEAWVSKYPDSIKLISKKNEGAGSTVNSGIKNATSKYFKMVDGDDWVETEALDHFIELLENCDSDMVVSDYVFFDNSVKEKKDKQSFTLPVKKEFLFDDEYQHLPQEMHALCFRTEIMKDITLDNGFYTDVEYLLFPLPKVKTVTYFDEALYVYRVGQMNQSVSPQSRMKNLSHHTAVLNHCLEFLDENKENLTEGHRNFIIKRIDALVDNQMVIYLLFKTSKERKQDIKNLVNQVSQYPELMELYKNNKKYKLLRKSNFILYPFVARQIKKKEGLK